MKNPFLLCLSPPLSGINPRRFRVRVSCLPEGYRIPKGLWEAGVVPCEAEITLLLPFLRMGENLDKAKYLTATTECYMSQVLYFLRALSKPELLALCVGWKFASPIIEWWFKTCRNLSVRALFLGIALARMLKHLKNC